MAEEHPRITAPPVHGSKRGFFWQYKVGAHPPNPGKCDLIEPNTPDSLGCYAFEHVELLPTDDSRVIVARFRCLCHSLPPIEALLEDEIQNLVHHGQSAQLADAYRELKARYTTLYLEYHNNVAKK